MAIKTNLKRLDEMEVGDIMLRNTIIEKGKTFSVDTKNKIQYEVIEPFKDNKIVVKNVDTNEMKVYNGYGYLQFEVLMKKAKR